VVVLPSLGADEAMLEKLYPVLGLSCPNGF